MDDKFTVKQVLESKYVMLNAGAVEPFVMKVTRRQFLELCENIKPGAQLTYIPVVCGVFMDIQD